jgi:DNA polymerase III gamma/tau subunit
VNTTRSNRWWLGLAVAGVALTASGCAGMRGERNASSSGNPATQRTAASQKQSQEALDRAADAQKAATDQSQKAADAQVQVQKAQEALTKAQDKSRAEQQKAQQLQNEANQARQQANQTSQQAQQQASEAIQQQGQQLARHQDVTSGQVLNASADRLTVRHQDGSSMTFQVNGSTQVLIDGQPSPVAGLQPGEDVHVTYQLSGAEPLALTIQAASGNAASAQGTGSTGTGAPAAPPAPPPPPDATQSPPADTAQSSGTGQ